MSESLKTKLEKTKTFVKQHHTAVVAGTSFVAGVGATLWCITAPNPRPIPDLLLTTSEIKRDIAAGILAVEFFKQKGLTDEFVEFAQHRVAELIQ